VVNSWRSPDALVWIDHLKPQARSIGAARDDEKRKEKVIDDDEEYNL
jgi:hypothetical protein